MMYEDFEEEEGQNVIVDFDIIEAAKENIQPLARGRSVTALASVLKTPHGQRDARLLATKARLRERVEKAREAVDELNAKKGLEADKGEEDAKEDRNEEDEEDEEDYGDDDDDEEALTLEEAEGVLMDAYVHLVKWTIEHYPGGQSAESGILELLEEATRMMRHLTIAKSDPRYLELWLRYATYVDKPELIFEFLLTNEIGTMWGKLYEQYAGELEKANRRSKADDIYMLGIARKAEPLDHLERRHREFQKRMMVAAPVLGDGTDDDATTTPSSNPVIETAPRRKILGETMVRPSSSAASSLVSRDDDVFSAIPSSSSLATTASTSSATGSTRPNGKIQVYVDPIGSAGEIGSRNAWPTLETKAERTKENKRKAEKMQGTILKQKGAAKAATREAAAKARSLPKIVPFRDPVPEPTDSTPGVKTRSATRIAKLKEKEKESSVPTAGTKPSSSAAKSTVFKEPEPPVAAVASSLSKAKASTSKFVPYRDPEAQVAPSKKQGTSKIVPFRDPEPKETRKGQAATITVHKTPAKSSFMPYIDPVNEEAVSRSKEALPTPATPRFVPYRDPVVPETPATQTNTGSVMRLREIGPKASSKEGDALKKDPFKNYKDI